MLLLDITTFELKNSVKLYERLKQVESKGSPKGLKVVNQWFEAGGGRVITIYDVKSVKDYTAYNSLFTDLCRVDVFPVIGVEEFKKFASKYTENLL
ncbi:hypothetical protein EO98_08525 [Methanosarcina sp. 2.H.T.1A.6]|nr:hypothetical protein EO94_10380 [Methanosarcina sp. 2.H.T.1A.3]KKG15475.1 hypothetical protein EO97_11840 [Methanosarcina sp. 2.H.T.1A.15]KKG20132.1 hypothetical protein EO98_08525 [Methanosarcina sp. 2.H.T.1A.6]KKG23550.1 hypothetical protein EO96_08585 [Methanosarcina sp. 2.H.T.1A.8]